MGSYIPSTKAQQQEMLSQLGLQDFKGLYQDVPASMYLEQGLNIPAGMSELEVRRAVSAMAGENRVFSTVLRGAGRLRPLYPQHCQVHPRQGGIPHRLYPLPGGNEPGDLAIHL